VRKALELSDASGGAFDPTLQPLLNLWGFGSEGVERTVPTDEAIAECKARTGWAKLTVSADNALLKTEPEVSLALGAIAKGFGVDAIGQILEDEGLSNWFVEIGGEVVVQGKNPTGEPWRIGIQYPSTTLMEEGRLQGILHLTTGAVATSGDYRNYLERDGQIYSHILDPRSGRAVLTDTASVSVYAPNCTDADGLATALYVMGPDEGLQWIETMPGVEALFLVRSGESIIERFSSGFLSATGYTSVSGVDPSHPEPN
jgi:thiamine biosynthesis lipoprotein